MKIHKLLNNNVVISLDKAGNEQIIMGKAIGFKKKQGDDIDESLIEKQFSLTHQELLPKFVELLSKIPLEIIAVSERIIEHAKCVLGDQLQESIYISLTDHIHFAIERHKQGLNISNNFLWEIKNFYPQEFKLGEYGLQQIKKRLKIELFEDEAGFIALHILNSQLNHTMSNTMIMTKIINEILHIVKYYFKLEYNEKSLTYHRFITHLKFFSQRIIHGNFIASQDLSLYQMIKEKYQDAYLCTKKIDLHLIQQYKHPLTDDESLYLTIHIERLRHELQNEQNKTNCDDHHKNEI